MAISNVIFSIFVIMMVVTLGQSQTEVCLRVPPSVDACYAETANHPVDQTSAKIDCLSRLLWFYEPDQNLTAADRAYFNSLSSQRAFGDQQPRTGFRMRKEYRLLTDVERGRLNEAFKKLYSSGVIRRYANVHAVAVRSAHNGAAFLAWHRVFLALFEDELRMIDRTVSLPYWDSTMDNDMGNAVNSVLWSPQLLGNGYGDVVNGPFAFWQTSRGPLNRRYGTSGNGILINKDTVTSILTKCRTDDVVWPLQGSQENRFVIEYIHNSVHNWVGGTMWDPAVTAYDPVFYMHHAFIDYIWELFRRRQRDVCLIEPSTAYATNTGGAGHGANDRMSGMENFRNIDGLANYWTTSWYNYVAPPACPNCGSKYLWCDTTRNRCVSHSRRRDFNVGQFRETSSEPFEPETAVVDKRIAHPFLPSPLSDGRTRATALRDAKAAVEARRSIDPRGSIWPASDTRRWSSSRRPGNSGGQHPRRKHISLL